MPTIYLVLLVNNPEYEYANFVNFKSLTNEYKMSSLKSVCAQELIGLHITRNFSIGQQQQQQNQD